MGYKLSELPEHVRKAIEGQDLKAVKPRQASPVVASDFDPLAKLNKTERAYERILAERKRSGVIRDYRVQAMTFLLGPDCRYTPDFVVIEQGGTLTSVDTKGTFVREDAIIKLKTAAAQFPWIRWQMIENRKGDFVTVRDLNVV